jgi:hypothetical protein
VVSDTSLAPSNKLTIMTATQGAQISTSLPDKQLGLMTYYFIDALVKGKKGAGEIYEYIKPMIEDGARKLNVEQSPTITPDLKSVATRLIL